MLKVALQWLVDEYKISKVTFSDKSHSSQGFMLPEKMVLTEGQTWYQKYFDVQPDNDVTKATLKAYGRLYNEHKDYFKSLANNSWAMPKIRDKLKPFDKELKKQQLSGSVWHMTKQTIKGYNVPYSIHKEVLGGSKKMRGALHFTPSIWW
jgi:ribosomal protein L11 methylase PrmA